MPTFGFFIGLFSVAGLITFFVWLLQSKDKKQIMLNLAFICWSLVGIFVCVYEYLVFFGLTGYIYLCEIGGILFLFLAVIFFIKSCYFCKKIPTTQDEKELTSSYKLISRV